MQKGFFFYGQPSPIRIGPTCYANIDWTALEEQFKAKLTSMYVLLPVKVAAEIKEAFNKAIKQLASEHGIREKDSAKAAGQVFALLLGLSQ
jgi:hypothetical protein